MIDDRDHGFTTFYSEPTDEERQALLQRVGPVTGERILELAKACNMPIEETEEIVVQARTENVFDNPCEIDPI